jgi:hypothetical protein
MLVLPAIVWRDVTRAPWRMLAVFGGVALLLTVLLGAWPGWSASPTDAHAYWDVDAGAPYGARRVGAPDGFFYSPAFAQLVRPLQALPFDAFAAVWRSLSITALLVVGAAPMLAFPPVVEDLVRGNIHILLAACIVLGFRVPALWAVVLLTKLTPGIGLVWFAVRREWDALSTALAATLAVVLGSMLIGGSQVWLDWVDALAGNVDSLRSYAYLGIEVPPLVLRLPIAVLIVAWGGLTDRRWAVPLGALLALPVLWPSSFALLAAIPLLRGRGAREAYGRT